MEFFTSGLASVCNNLSYYYNGAYVLYAYLQQVTSSKVNAITHTRPFPPGFIASYAVADTEDDGIKPRELFEATMIFDLNQIERNQNNTRPNLFPNASCNLMTEHERIAIIALHILLGPKFDSKIDSPRKTLFKYAIPGMFRNYRSYYNDPNNKQTTALLIKNIAVLVEKVLAGADIPAIPGKPVSEETLEKCRSIVKDEEIVDIINKIDKRKLINREKGSSSPESQAIRNEIYKIIMGWGIMYKAYMDEKAVL